MLSICLVTVEFPRQLLANFVRGLKVNFCVFPKWSSLVEKVVVGKVMDPNEDPG